MATDSAVIFWPTTSTTIRINPETKKTVAAHTNNERSKVASSSVEDEEGYLIGWDEVVDYHSTHSSPPRECVEEQHPSPTHHSSTRITVVLPCIIKTTPSDGYDLIQRAVDVVTAQTPDTNFPRCETSNCSCYRSLKIVGRYYKAGESSNAIPDRLTARNKETRIDDRHGCDHNLPSLVSTLCGPWWYNMVEDTFNTNGNSNNSHSNGDRNQESMASDDASSSNDEKVGRQHKQLVLYDCCGGESTLAHYTTASNDTSTISNSDAVGPFECTLQRISEAQAIAEQLTSVLQDVSNTACSNNKKQRAGTSRSKTNNKATIHRQGILSDTHDKEAPSKIPKHQTTSKISLNSTPPPAYFLPTLQKCFQKVKRSSLTYFHLRSRSGQTIPIPPCLQLLLTIQRSSFPLNDIQTFFSRLDTKDECTLPRSVRSWRYFTSSQGNSYNSASSDAGSVKAGPYIARSFLDTALGIAVGILLWHNLDVVYNSITQLWSTLFTTLQTNIRWLEAFPVGFKLNEKLTETMGYQISMVLCQYETLRSYLFSLVSVGNGDQHMLLKLLSTVSITMGFSTLICILFDTIQLSTLHVRIISAVFQHIYCVQLTTVSSLWKLFRGKKVNILRNRTDTLEHVDFMQLLLGMLLFTILLFLYTTILVYYFFCSVICYYCVVEGLLLGSIYVCYTLVDKLPLWEVLCRLLPGGATMFGKDVYFVSITPVELQALIPEYCMKTSSSATNDAPVIHRLQTVSHSHFFIIRRAYGSHVSRIARHVIKFPIDVVRGTPTSFLDSLLVDT